MWSLVAIVWVAGFSIWFYQFKLPNNPSYSRPDIWLLVPDQLADLVDPPAEDQGSAWANVWERADVYGLAAMIVLGVWGLGHAVLSVLRLPLAERCAERSTFAFGCGTALFSLIMLGSGLAGWLERPLFAAVLAGGIVAGVAARAGAWVRLIATLRGREKSRARSGGSAGHRGLAAVCVMAVAPFVVAMLLGATLPPTDFDAKAYHLTGPKEWFLDGRISFLPHNVYTSFPFLTEMLSLAGMVLRDDWYRGALVGQVVLSSFALFTAVGLYAAGRRWFSPAAGWLAVLVFLTTPWTYRISTIAYAEGGLSFFLFATFLAVLITVERRAAGESPWGMGLVAGLLAGSGMACKYTGLVQVVLPLGAALLVGIRWRGAQGMTERRTVPASENADRESNGIPSRGGAARVLLMFAAGLAIAVGPWLLRNTVQTGNPVYPLAYSIFGGRDWNAQLDERFRAGHSSSADQYTASHLAANLIDVAARNDWHSALLFALAPLAFLTGRNRALVLGCWLYVGYLFLAWWVLTHRIDRFWVPMIPVVALLAGVGATWSRHTEWKIACGIALAAGVLFNLAFVSTPLAGNNLWLGDVGRLRPQAERTAPTITLLNELYDAGRLPGDAKLLLVGDAQVFDARFPHVYNTVFDHSIFEQWFGERDAGAPDGWRVADEETIRRRLSAAGVTHVAVNWQELLRYRTTYGYTDFVTPGRFRTLVERGVLGEPVRLSQAGYEALPESQRDHLDRWAPELKSETRDGARYIAAQLFPVLPARSSQPDVQ